MLRVPWSKVTSIGDKALQVLRVPGVFQGSILRDTARTRSISGMITLNTACTRSILGFDTLKYCCTPSIYITRDTLGTPSNLDVCTPATACTRVYVLLILPLLGRFGPSILLILQVLRVFTPPVL